MFVSNKENKIRPALLVIDVQRAFLPFMSEQDRRLAPWSIGQAIDLFRNKKLPVIHVHHSDPVLGPKGDAPEFQAMDGLQAKAGETVIIKSHPSAFKETDLEGRLREMKVDTLFLVGLSVRADN